MPEAKDTLARLFTLLRLIPQHPRYASTATLRDKLDEQGFAVDIRTVQRDLNRLSLSFALTSQEDPKRNRNLWSRTRNTLDLQDMEPATALALYLAESHLKNLLPKSVLDLLGPQFNRARQLLDNLGQNAFPHWAQCVRTLPNGKALLPAPVEADVWQEVSAALLERKQLRVHYLSCGKTEARPLLIHPAGLISRHAIGYLIASVEGYGDLRQFALHRIQQAERQDAPTREHPGFDIDHYICRDLNTSAPIEPIELIADVSPQIAWLLGETPLSAEQTLEPLPDTDWQRLRATVQDDQETLWWVFGLGEKVRVWEPESLAEKLRERLAKMQNLYVSN